MRFLATFYEAADLRSAEIEAPDMNTALAVAQGMGRRAGATGWSVEPIDSVRIHGSLVPDWCRCDHDTGFLCYPGDGECLCGVHKHHVHGRCGHVVQVG